MVEGAWKVNVECWVDRGNVRWGLAWQIQGLNSG